MIFNLYQCQEVIHYVQIVFYLTPNKSGFIEKSLSTPNHLEMDGYSEQTTPKQTKTNIQHNII